MSRHLELETLSALLDGELETTTADGAQAHVAECADCRARLEGLRSTIGQLQSLPPASPPPHVREALRRQLATEQEIRRRLWTLPGWHSRLAAWPAMAAAVFLAFGCGLFLYAYTLRHGATSQQAPPAPVASSDEWRATITYDAPREEQPAAGAESASVSPPAPPAARVPAPAEAERLAKRPAPPVEAPAVAAQAESDAARPAAADAGSVESREAASVGSAAPEPVMAEAAEVAPAAPAPAGVVVSEEARNRQLARREAAAASARADTEAKEKSLADGEVIALGPGVERPVKLSGASPDLQEFRTAPPLIVIESTVGTDGRLHDLSFRPANLDQRIVDRLRQALSTWRFEPARKDGRPVAVRYTLTLNIHFQ